MVRKREKKKIQVKPKAQQFFKANKISMSTKFSFHIFSNKAIQSHKIIFKGSFK